MGTVLSPTMTTAMPSAWMPPMMIHPPMQQQQPRMQQQGQQYAVHMMQGGFFVPIESNMGNNMGNGHWRSGAQRQCHGEYNF